MSIARRVMLACSFALLFLLGANGAARADEPSTAAEPVAESTPAADSRGETASAPTTTAASDDAGETAAEPIPPVPATPPVMPPTVVTPRGIQGERATAPRTSPLAAAAEAGKSKASGAAATQRTNTPAAQDRPEGRTSEQPRTVSLGRYGAIELGRPPQAASRWRGFPISLSLRDAPLPEVLRSFARIAGVNLVLHPGVTGTVTVELQDVPWDQALYVILKTQGMAAEIDGRVWIVQPN